MAKFNADFWEVTLASESWGAMPAERAIWYETPEDVAARHQRMERAQALWPELRAAIEETLTDRQREVVLLHFVEGLNQREIAERLGVTQQAVSEHLYGKARDGHNVGGAIRKLRRACLERGVRWGPGAGESADHPAG